MCNGSQMARSGPGKTREKAETGLKGSIKVFLLSQVITEMNILQHQSTKQKHFSSSWNMDRIAQLMECYYQSTCIYIFFKVLVMVCVADIRRNVTSWPVQVNNSSYLFPQVQVKKSLLSWACCDAYLAQRCAEGAGHGTDEAAFKGHCTQSAT